MKKILSFWVLWLVVATLLMITPVSHAQTDLDEVAKLLAAGDRWYGTADIVTIKQTTSTSITLISPYIKKNGQTITGYKATYAEKPIALASSSEIKTKDILLTWTSGTGFEILLDGLKTGITYYIALEPVDGAWQLWLPSDQIQASTSSTSPITTQPALNAAWPGSCEVENISYTQDGTNVVMTRTPTSSDTSIDLFLRFGTETQTTKLATVDWDQGRYAFIVSRPGTYFVTFTPILSNGTSPCQEKVQTIKVNNVSPDIQRTSPSTGPSENSAIALAIVAGLCYIMYRRQSSAKNK